jgi:regulatory protein spx
MIRVFILSSNPSSRKAVAHLQAVGQEFEVRNMGTEPLTFEELKDILSYTENGTDDIIAKNGKVYKELLARGIDVESLPLSKLYLYVKCNPRLIKAPLIIGKGIMQIGYNVEDFSEFYPRGMRLRERLSKLKALRREDMAKIAAGKEIPTGYWGSDNWISTSLVSASQ